MAQSVHAEVGCPMQHRSKPSSSLEGMEKPFRSFKAFLKTSPPKPSSLHNISPQKPLPPTPARPPPREKTPSPLEPPKQPTTQRIRNSSVASWQAICEWSRAISDRNILPASVDPPVRACSPLLPEPSPDPFESSISTVPGDLEGVENRHSQLEPIMERPDTGRTCPPAPPNSPLPAVPPKSPARIAAMAASPTQQSTRSSPSGKAPGPLPLPTRDATQLETPRSATPYSVSSERSLADKVHASRDLFESMERSYSLTNDHYRPKEASITERPSVDLERHDSQNITEVPANQENRIYDQRCDSDDSLDERMRHLDVLQDYHDVLVDQYIQSKASAGEKTDPRAADSAAGPGSSLSRLKTFPGDEHLVPNPLAWHKQWRSHGDCSDPPTGADKNDHRRLRKDSMSPTKKKVKWVPRRLGMGHAFSKGASLQGKKNKTQTPKDLQFSKFFHPSRPPRRRSGSVRSNGPRRGPRAKARRPAEPTGAIPSLPLSPFPGLGIAVVAESSPTPPASKKAQHPGASSPAISKAFSGKFCSGESDRPSPPAVTHIENLRIAATDDVDSSWGNQIATEPPPYAQASFGADLLRRSGVSVVSRFSGSSTYSEEDQDDMSEHHSSPAKAKNHSERRKSTGLGSVWKNSTGFLGKVRDKRHKQDGDARHDQLGRSMQVVGPANTETVARYVNRGGRLEYEPEECGRKPGYVVWG